MSHPSWKGFLLVAAGLLAPLAIPAHETLVPGEPIWVSPIRVSLMEKVDNTLYLGGPSSWFLGPHTGNAVALDLDTGEALDRFPVVEGTVMSIIRDGRGGWFVGGEFIRIGGVTRRGVARVLPDGTVDPNWNTGDKQYSVWAMVVTDNALFLGGGPYGYNYPDYEVTPFDALDLETGQSLNLPLEVEFGSFIYAPVTALAYRSGRVYIAGNFVGVGGKDRMGLAELDASTGLVTDWDPQPNSYPWDLKVRENILYVCGHFSTIGGEARGCGAAFDLNDYTLTAWNPETTSLYSMALADNSAYLFGTYNSVKGVERYSICEVDLITGTPTDWNPSVFEPYEGFAHGLDIALTDAEVILGTSSPPYPDKPLVRLDRTTGNEIPWNVRPNGSIITLLLEEEFILAGGGANSTAAVGRSGVAAIDLTTGEATDWAPVFDDNVYAHERLENSLYVGGSFETIDGQSRNGIASFDLATHELTSFSADLPSSVSRMHGIGGSLYVYGATSSGNGVFTYDITELDATTGEPLDFQPALNGRITGIDSSADTVYFGGEFTTFDGEQRDGLAAINHTSGDLLPWAPPLDGNVEGLMVHGDRLYVWGNCLLVSFDLTTGNQTDWQPPNPCERFLGIIGTRAIKAGGPFVSQDYQHLYGVDLDTGAITFDGLPTSSGRPEGMAVFDHDVFFYGFFFDVGGTPSPNLARLRIEYPTTGWGVY